MKTINNSCCCSVVIQNEVLDEINKLHRQISLGFQVFSSSFLALLLTLSSISHAGTPNQTLWRPTIIKSLPGYPGDLPFHLETGYIGVGEEEQVQLFYYFIESERDPQRDPLILWLTGGPGCSAFSGLVIEIGPLIFNQNASYWQSGVPKLDLNPYSWTKVASVIFLDSPVGTGFSYATTSECDHTDDVKASWHIYEFLNKWLMDHVEFRNNPLYIAGDSYSGITVPIVVQEILNGNAVGFQPKMNLKGYILGNPFTVKEDQTKSRFEFAHRVSLLSDELYESLKISCNGNYGDVDVANTECRKNLQAVSFNLDSLFRNHVLEPACNPLSPQTWCRDNTYWVIFIWANNIRVQEALHIRKGTKIHWIRCNKTLAYAKNVESSFAYHQNLTRKFIRVLIYSGDQDMVIPYVGTLEWINKLNISITQEWSPWYVKHQVAGYTKEYSSGLYNLTFATVKGGGHTAPEYKPQECLTMITKWFAMHPL